MTDNNEISKPSTCSAEVYSTGDQEDLPIMDDFVREFPEVFSETVEKFTMEVIKHKSFLECSKFFQVVSG